jgi:hypothetical protein
MKKVELKCQKAVVPYHTCVDAQFQVLRQQHNAAKARAPEGETARKAHPILKTCFGIVEPVDLGDPTQLELMTYWIFERFAEEDASASNADMFDTDDLEHNKKPLLDLASEVRCRNIRE